MVLALAALLAPLLIVGPQAAAEPPPDAERRVERLQRESEAAAERYNEIREELRGRREKVAGIRVRLSQQRRAIAGLRADLGRLAAETYRKGELSALNMLLSDDPDDYLSGAGLVSTFAQRRDDAIGRLRAGLQRLVTDKRAASAAEGELTRTFDLLQRQAEEVKQRLAVAQAELRRVRAREAAAARAREAAAARASRSADRSTPSTATPVGTTCRDVDITAPSARVKRVIDFACAQLGEAYLWGAAGPDRWDCSGFTMKAWQQGGVSLPHSSRMQAGYGTRISLSQARAGDLVFSYSPISHVAISLGNGMVIYAPQTGDVVKIAPVRAANVTAVTRL
jgi:cell wall-associated NlpC family hydrolase